MHLAFGSVILVVDATASRCEAQQGLVRHLRRAKGLWQPPCPVSSLGETRRDEWGTEYVVVWDGTNTGEGWGHSRGLLLVRETDPVC